MSTSSVDPFEDPIRHKQYLKIALSGEGGSGKTRFLLSFPKVCVIDTEKGTLPYRGKYDFKMRVATRWRQLDAILKWLRANPGVYETLAIDSATIFYLDLIQDIVDYIKNKRGNEIMSPGDWMVEKRRWAALLNQLVELPMHVILSFREKDEYQDVVGRNGEESRKKTGNFMPEWDRQTEYMFDLGFRCHTENDKKAKTTKFLLTCTKTRFDWAPKYGIWNATGKHAFDEFFAPHAAALLDAPDAPVTPVETAEPLVVADATPAETAPDEPIDATPRTTDENNTELKRFFLESRPSPDQPEATPENRSAMIMLALRMSWPDSTRKCRRQFCNMKGHVHEEFTTEDAKALLFSAYNVASSAELRAPQVEFLHNEFSKVLEGRAFLDQDPENNGAIYIATPIGTSDEEVRAKVLQMA